MINKANESPIRDGEYADIRYVKGDATSPIGDGQKIIIHCCNDCKPGKWGSGFVMAISKKWKSPEVQYRKWSKGYISELPYELGQVQFVRVEDDIVVGNMIGQHDIRQKGCRPPIRYGAIEKCLKKIRNTAIKNKASVHAPKFGSDRAGGSWGVIEQYLQDIFCKNNVQVTIYEL